MVGAALLAPVALLGIVWPGAGAALLLVDAAWLLVLAIDAGRVWAAPSDAVVLARETPSAFSLGRQLPVTWRWTSRLPWRARVQVAESLPDTLAMPGEGRRELQLEPGGALVERHLVTPRARGKGGTGAVHLRFSSPWGLASRGMLLQVPWAVTIYPTLARGMLRALPTQAQRRREAGLRNVRRLGEGRVFESLREWVPGDDSRTLDWKATARRGKPMVRQYEDERRQQVLLVIDCGRLMTVEHRGRSRLEYVVDAALQLSHAALERDDNIGLLTFSDTVHQYLAPARGRRALRGVLDALAVVKGYMVEPDYPQAFAWLAQKHRRRALTVVFTDVIDRSASDALLAQLGTLRPRHLPLAVALRDPSLDEVATGRPESVDAAFARAAAEELLQSREVALTEMRARGIIVLDVAPARAAEAVVEQYHQLKRRALL